MPKRVTACMIIMALILSLSGCASIYSKEYLAVDEVKDENVGEGGGTYTEISNYDELKKAVVLMINSLQEEKRFKFPNYVGDSDELQSDIAQAFWEAKTETALGGYAVDYTSHDFGKIMTYYEATVYIKYKRTPEEIRELRYVSGIEGLESAISAGLGELKTDMAVKMSSDSISADEVALAVQRAFEADPLTCVLYPQMKVSVFPNEGIQRIIQVEISYSRSKAVLTKMRTELSDAVEKLTQNTSKDDLAYYALQACNSLYSASKYVNQETTGEDETDELVSSAYGALVNGEADSRGFALAYSALCREAGIKSIVVSGTLDKAAHHWNIIELDGAYYHVDVSAGVASGTPAVFMSSDEQMQGRYWWNIESYPECGKETG